MTDKAIFDWSRFDYTRFDAYLPRFDLMTEKLEHLSRGRSDIPPAILGTFTLGSSRLGVTSSSLSLFQALIDKVEAIG